jgi:hypothetical protein
MSIAVILNYEHLHYFDVMEVEDVEQLIKILKHAQEVE